MTVAEAAEPFFAFLLGEGQHQVNRKRDIIHFFLTFSIPLGEKEASGRSPTHHTPASQVARPISTSVTRRGNLETGTKLIRELLSREGQVKEL